VIARPHLTHGYAPNSKQNGLTNNPSRDMIPSTSCCEGRICGERIAIHWPFPKPAAPKPPAQKRHHVKAGGWRACRSCRRRGRTTRSVERTIRFSSQDFLRRVRQQIKFYYCLVRKKFELRQINGAKQNVQEK
jgi:hypothetical protein